jgi:hypothetical protein
MRLASHALVELVGSRGIEKRGKKERKKERKKV